MFQVEHRIKLIRNKLVLKMLCIPLIFYKKAFDSVETAAVFINVIQQCVGEIYFRTVEYTYTIEYRYGPWFKLIPSAAVGEVRRRHDHLCKWCGNDRKSRPREW